MTNSTTLLDTLKEERSNLYTNGTKNMTVNEYSSAVYAISQRIKKLENK